MRPFDAGIVAGRKQRPVTERQRSKRNVHRKWSARRHVPIPRPGGAHRDVRMAARNARSSPVAGSTPVAPEIMPHWPGVQLGGNRCPTSVERRLVARRPRGSLGRKRPSSAGPAAWRRAPRHGCAPRAPGTRRASRAPSRRRAAALPDRSKLSLQIVAARTRTAAACPRARSCASRRPARCRCGRPGCAASAMRTASTPADSSPMKVREEPVTPCTMEMLPASRFDSCARNSVGRRSLISRSLRKASGSAPCASPVRIVPSTAIVALAAAGGDDHVHARKQVGIALDAGALSSARPAA